MKNLIRFILVFAVILILSIANGCGEDQNPTGGNNSGNPETVLFSLSSFSIQNPIPNYWYYRDTAWSTQNSLKKVRIELRLQTTLGNNDTAYLNINAFSTGIDTTIRTDENINQVYSYEYGDGISEITIKHGSFMIGLRNHSGNCLVKISEVKVIKVK